MSRPWLIVFASLVACSSLDGHSMHGPTSGGAGTIVSTGSGASGTGMVSVAGTGGGYAATGGGGVSGTGGPPATGSGLEVCWSSFDKPPACGPDKCGNGVRDSCGGGTLYFCPPVRTEECDGLDVRDNCALHGYGSGAMICGANCAIDESRCRECVFAPAGTLAACGEAPVVTQAPVALGIAATDTEVGLAWVDQEDNDKNKRTLTFARLSPTLSWLGTTLLEDKVHTATPLPDRSIMGTSVAPIASGWVVAAAGESEVFIHALDAQGKDLGRASVAKVAQDFFKSFPADIRLTAANAGGPLLLWRSETGVRAALVAADGRSTMTPISLPLGADTTVTSAPSAVFVGDSFYVAYGIQIHGLSDGLQFVRVKTNGGVVDLGFQMPSESATAPSLVAGANELRLTYVGTVVGTQQGVLWRRLSLSGEFLSDPVAISKPYEISRSPAVPVGDDAIVIIAARGGTVLEGTRVSSAGAIVTPHFQIALTPKPLGSHDVARVGSAVVAAWLVTTAGPSRIGLARLTP